MQPQVAAAVNARWCDLVCRRAGIATRHDAVAWSAATRSPAYHPDLLGPGPVLSWDGEADLAQAGSAGWSLLGPTRVWLRAPDR